VEYQWDASSNRTTMTATAGSSPKVTSYNYDNALRLSTVKGADDGASQTTYNYDPVGLRVGMTLPNGISITYGYNSLNRLASITQKNSGGTVLVSYTYTLDPVGNRTKVDEFGGNYNQWLYDDSYRLISETRKVSSDPITTTTFAYDKTGNRLSYSTNGSLTTSYLYNELDQLLSEGSKLYSYDKRGNLSGVSGGTYYTWDVMDRLIGASVPGGTASYLYDADGRRVKQTIGSAVTNFLWDEQSAYGDVTLETDGSNAITANYTIGQGCPICDVSGLLSQNKGGTVSYFLKDGQGNVRNLTNGSGSIVESYSYDAFGTRQSGPTNPITNYLYTGQQFDNLTNLYDLRARYYNPGVGRFWSADRWDPEPLKSIEYNKYVYVANDPINSYDPLGYFKGPEPSQTTSQTTGNDYSLLLTSVALLTFASITVYGLWTACLIAKDLSSVIAATGGNPDIIPAPEQCKSEKKQTCETKFPNYIRCDKLPNTYKYGSLGATLKDFKLLSGYKSIVTREKQADRGPCSVNSGYVPGTHLNVYEVLGKGKRGDYVGAIGCCNCCEDKNRVDPVILERYAILNYKKKNG